MIKYSNIKALVIHLKHLTQSVYDILLVIINRDYLPVENKPVTFCNVEFELFFYGFGRWNKTPGLTSGTEI